MTSRLAIDKPSSPKASQPVEFDMDSAHNCVREIVEASGTSFFWAMRLLPKDRRKAIFAVYAFCREVDDIVDEAGEDEDKRVALEHWRGAISHLYTNPDTHLMAVANKNMAAILKILFLAIKNYDLQEEDFYAVIDGMEMDARGPVAIEDMAGLDLYCDRVASAVGRLCVPIFGQADAKGREVANYLGRALQLTNIIRDVPEDAEIERLYLPQELLATYGIENQPPHAVALHDDLPKVCANLGSLAQDYFSKAEAAIAACDPKAMKAPIVMMRVYYLNLKRLRAVGWQPQTLRHQSKLAKVVRKLEKLIIGIRYGLF